MVKHHVCPLKSTTEIFLIRRAADARHALVHCLVLSSGLSALSANLWPRERLSILLARDVPASHAGLRWRAALNLTCLTSARLLPRAAPSLQGRWCSSFFGSYSRQRSGDLPRRMSPPLSRARSFWTGTGAGTLLPLVGPDNRRALRAANLTLRNVEKSFTSVA